jgi:rhomboid protease GluP
MSLPSDPQATRNGIAFRLSLSVLIAVCVGIELALTAADYRVLDVPRLRMTAYEYAGFWPRLLIDGWQSNYPGQKILMFASYALLHGGLLHLGMNMFTLCSLGNAVVDRVGPTGFITLYLGATLGGAIGYATLNDSLLPMVGASGALFGLAGALVAWFYLDQREARGSMGPIYRVLLYLLGINVVMYWALSGQLAWETHLGGFVVGWLLALTMDPTD